MVMDYLNGGDIFYHLSVSRRFPEERCLGMFCRIFQMLKPSVQVEVLCSRGLDGTGMLARAWVHL